MKRAAIVIAAALLAGGAGLAVGLRAQGPTPTAEVHERYQCPMHPSVIRDHPGECPICGMKLVKLDPQAKTADTSQVEGLATIEVDPQRQQLIGLRTAEVDRGDLGAAIRTFGRVSVDETQVRKVSVKAGGYVEKVYADFLGKPVKKGQPLFSFYSPEIFAAETEWVSMRGSPLATAAHKKLELWDVPASELQRLEREGAPSKTVTMLSPANGVITRKEIVEGARLEPGAMPYEVVDLSTVWVLADVYERELRHVTTGASATLTLEAFPGRSWAGKVLFVDPLLDPKTRSAKVRLAFDNSALELKPELFGEVTLARAPRPVLRVPTDALLRGGENDIAFVALGDGRFEPRKVKLGEVGRDYAEVLEGLSEGDRVVTKANFLIDSESRLRSSMQQNGSAPIGSSR